ncbi:MAG: hypothetical protein KAV18_06215 [Candidatus Omnitrophica bacterium]|nr:hypothetical protein [Candidatus Omnitrophota bacterium]
MEDVKKQEQELEDKALIVADAAKEIQINSKVDYDQASEFVEVVCSAGMKSIETFFKDMIDSVMEAKRAAEASRKTIVGRRDGLIEPYKTAKKSVGILMLKYEDEQKRIEAEIQRKADEAARKIAEDEQVAAAAAAEAEGDTETAEMILDQPTVAAPVQVEKETFNRGKNAGISKHYYADVTNLALVPKEYLIPDMVALNGIARAQKENMKISGVVARWS